MAADKTSRSPGKAAGPKGQNGQHRAEPEWSEGLRKLYDSVVEEPLPDSFKDLLSKLDDAQPGDES